jgi:gamma-glutamyltranspeptidase/glutathione hydrolase
MALSRTILSEHAAVASEHPLASLTGRDILKKGGSAVDAAVATSFVLAVTQHQLNGLGGDFFAMIYIAKTGKVHCLNSSGWAPSGRTLDLLTSKGQKNPQYGPFSVVVPGAVAGIYEMHRKFGKLDFKELTSAAEGYASDGFPASEGLCRSVRRNFDSLPTSARKVFAPRGVPPDPGEIIRQRELAETIVAVGREGSSAFYRGKPAEQIRNVLSEGGVEAKESDFSDFKPEWVNPLQLEYAGTTVFEFPPNSMGVVCLLMLEYLSEHGLSKTKPLSLERVTLTMKAAEIAYRRRDMMLGDPRFSRIDIDGFLRLDEDTPSGTRSEVKTGDTTAFSVVDSEGNIVSAIQSLFHQFGSRVFVPNCGIMLSSRAAGFSETGPNKLEPRKRPLHTLSSLLLAKNDRPTLAIGCSGGDFRPMQHTLFITNLVDYSMTLEQSIDHPRFLISGRHSMLAEQGYEGLSGLPYEIEHLPYPGGTGVGQGVEVLPHARKAVCDVRGDGLPAGF